MKKSLVDDVAMWENYSDLANGMLGSRLDRKDEIFWQKSMEMAVPVEDDVAREKMCITIWVVLGKTIEAGLVIS